MKRFIIISLLTALTIPMSACIWTDNYNDYLFSPFEPGEFRERVQKTCIDNWKAYLGTTAEDYYYFDADEVIKFAQKRGDALMVSYVTHLQKYLDCAEQKQRETWDYPTKQQLNSRRQTLHSIQSYAQGKLKTRLRSQHALLLMRCNMLLDRHTDNIKFWEQTGSQLIETVYKDMMKNIYAGALYKTGCDEAAARIFAEQGDWQSLMTQYYKRRSCEAITQEYQRNPNSPVLPFLVKDFVNNAQEAIDSKTEWNIGGKLFIRDISQKEASQMCQLANRVISEGKTDIPAMWQSAKAWLEFLFGKREQGVNDIMKATKMSGTPRMLDNTRVLMLYMTAAQARLNASFDDYLAGELEWLDGKVKHNDIFFEGARDRLVHQVLRDKYQSRPTTKIALLKALCSSEYNICIDTVGADVLRQYLNYAQTSGQTMLDRYLKARQKYDANAMNDLMGTKYLRRCQWQEAITWLQQVPVSYYGNKGYAPYAAHRRWTVEPWLKRQWLSDHVVYSDRKWQLKSNPKLDFAREMLRMESECKLLTSNAQQQRYYDLAVRYAQAHFTGDCWYLMRDGKSVDDTIRTNEADLAKKALELLKKASLSADFNMKERALFASSYIYLYEKPWYDEVWNNKTYVNDRKPDTRSQQYKAFATLAALEKQNATRTSQYVSHCDEFKQFKKFYK